MKLPTDFRNKRNQPLKVLAPPTVAETLAGKRVGDPPRMNDQQIDGVMAIAGLRGRQTRTMIAAHLEAKKAAAEARAAYEAAIWQRYMESQR